MEPYKETEPDSVKNETEWSESRQFNNVSDASDTNNFDPEDLKVKVEIELKEETNGLIYEPDFFGHLQLVNLNPHVPTECNNIENSMSDMKKWCYTQHSLPTSEEMKDIAVIRDQNHSRDGHVYGQLKNSYTSEGMCIGGKSEQSSIPGASDTYNFSLEGSWPQKFSISNQNCESYKHIQQVRSDAASILAEKKRNYRMRIKEENPTLWSAIKQKEACKKREQREERRLVLFEMQRTMGLISLSSKSPEVENHKLYLQVLQNRYPEVWKQLTDALSAAERRDKGLGNGQNPQGSRHLSKPVYLYKDVAEAHKKYLYRQKMKQERPEMYAEQKARESYLRRMKRMMQKKKCIKEFNGLQLSLPTSEGTKDIEASGEQNNQSNNEYVYGQNVPCNISKEIHVKSFEGSTHNNLQSSMSTSSEAFNFSLENSWQHQFPVSIQSSESYKHVPREKSEAEKKREYRMRIKEENPILWSERKQKEANKKREQREERRLVLFQMQRTMDLIALSSSSPEVENHKLYLQVLQERYPEVWKQLTNTSVAEKRGKDFINGQNSQNSRHLSKPVYLCKDVTEGT